MKRLNELERQILLNVLRDRDVNRQVNIYRKTVRGMQYVDEERQQIQQDAVDGIVPLRTREWLGDTASVTGDLAKACTRAYSRMERLGLIQRWALNGEQPNRTTHLQLLPAGERVANSISAGNGADVKNRKKTAGTTGTNKSGNRRQE
jgi:hypothetical protein